MAGLIDTERTKSASGRQATAQSVRGQMALPKGDEEAYRTIVAAGKKVLFSEQMAPEIKALLEGEGDMGAKIGQGVVALMAILLSKANGTIPPHLIVPAACELVAEAGEFLEEAGYEVTDQDVAEGMAVMVQEIMQRSGVDPEQLPQLLAQGGPAPQPQPAQPAASARPTEVPA